MADDDIESYWKVTRRTYFEEKSSRTMSMGEAMTRLTHAFLAYMVTTEQKIDGNQWGTKGPNITTYTVLPKKPEPLITDLSWGIRLTFNGLDLPGLPIQAEAETPEAALEMVFLKAVELLGTEVKKREEEVGKLRDQADDLETEAKEIHAVFRTMGAYDPKQMNLILKS